MTVRLPISWIQRSLLHEKIFTEPELMAEKGAYERKQHVHDTPWCINKRKNNLTKRKEIDFVIAIAGAVIIMIINTIKTIKLKQNTVKNKKCHNRTITIEYNINYLFIYVT